MLLRPSLAVVLFALTSSWAFSGLTANGQTPDAAVAPASYAEKTNSAEIEMIRQLARHRGGQPAALAQIIQLSREFDDRVAAEVIDELALAHLRAGNLNLAAECRTFLTERYPAEPLARQAMLWLVRLYASSEVAHARRGESAGAADLRRQLAPAVAGALKSAPDTISNDATASSKLPKANDQLSLYALHLATHAMSNHPALADDPALAFQRSVAARRAGQAKSSQALLSPLKHRGADDPWGQCARVEAWLQESKADAAPKPVVTCTAAEAPPHLDGILDDPCWQGQPASRGVPAPGANNIVETPAADVRWAHDRDYLYVAVQCRKLAGVDYANDDRPRPRDGDVEAHDRVRLLVDVDRDYASWFELVVDSRGWTADGCWGDAAWNPAWYVARGESVAGDAWTIEAAIPLSELSAAPTASGAAWACAVERHPPMVGGPDRPDSATQEPSPSAFYVLLLE